MTATTLLQSLVSDTASSDVYSLKSMSSTALASAAAPAAGSSALPTGDTVTISQEGRALAAATQNATQATAATAASTEVKNSKAGTTAIDASEFDFVTSAKMQSGREVTIERHSTHEYYAKTSYKVSISGADGKAEQSFMLTGDIIINEDDKGTLNVKSYTNGDETSGNDIIIGMSGKTLSGGDGDDTIVALRDNNNDPKALYSESSTTIMGGNGNDTIIIATDKYVGGHINTGSGNDTIFAQGASYNSTINTGDGNDTISISDGFAYEDIDTGSGDDIIMADGAISMSNIVTGDGNDSITADIIGAGYGNNHISTGAGNDSIKANWIGNAVNINNKSTDTIDMGDGNDTITSTIFSTGLINMGSGDDTVHGFALLTCRDGKQPSLIDAGDGDDSVAFNIINGVTTVQTGSGKDKINIGDIDTDKTSSGIAIETSSKSTSVERDDTRLTMKLTSNYTTDTYNTLSIFKNANKQIMGAIIDSGSGDDIVNISGTITNSIIEAGSGNDTVKISGRINGSTVDTYKGDDKINIEGITINSNIYTGTGNDNITISGTVKDSSIDSSKSSGFYSSVSADPLKDFLEAEEDNDTLNMSGQIINSSINMGKGNDAFTLKGSIDHSKISTGRGEDMVSIIGSIQSSTIDTDADKDSITIDGMAYKSTIDTGDTNDNVSIYGNSDTTTINGIGAKSYLDMLKTLKKKSTASHVC